MFQKIYVHFCTLCSKKLLPIWKKNKYAASLKPPAWGETPFLRWTCVTVRCALRGWETQQIRGCVEPSAPACRPTLSPPSVVVPVFGFERGAAGTSIKSWLLLAVVEAGQDQNAALLLRSLYAVTWLSLFLEEHDVLHQARDGSVNVGVVLEKGGRANIGKVWCQ